VKLQCFVITSHYNPSLIFAGKARSLHLEWSPIRGATLKCSLVGVAGSEKRCNLPRWRINYNRIFYRALACLTVRWVFKTVNYARKMFMRLIPDWQRPPLIRCPQSCKKLIKTLVSFIYWLSFIYIGVDCDHVAKIANIASLMNH